MPGKRHDGRRAVFFVTCVLLLLTLTHCPDEIKINLMSYNAGNLFDDRPDGTEYGIYDDGPAAGWSTAQFEAKLAAVARVIKSAVPGGPDFVALQEVENLNTLDRLCGSYLQGLHYDYRSMYPVAGSAHNCACISRYPVKRTGALLPGNWHGAPLRAILEAEIEIRGQTLFVFNNHWKAKSEGERQTESGRLQSAAVLITRLQSLLTANPAADIVVLGDFNEEVDEFIKAKGKYQTAFMPADTAPPDAGSFPAEALAGRTILLTGNPLPRPVAAGEPICLYDPWFETAGRKRGSYAFRGQWLAPDHILLAPGLFDDKAFMYEPGQFKTMLAEFLLDPQTGFPLQAKNRAYSFSDHLPLLLTLTLAGSIQ